MRAVPLHHQDGPLSAVPTRALVAPAAIYLRAV